MAVYTDVDDETLREFLRAYSIGDLVKKNADRRRR